MLGAAYKSKHLEREMHLTCIKSFLHRIVCQLNDGQHHDVLKGDRRATLIAYEHCNPDTPHPEMN